MLSRFRFGNLPCRPSSTPTVETQRRAYETGELQTKVESNREIIYQFKKINPWWLSRRQLLCRSFVWGSLDRSTPAAVQPANAKPEELESAVALLLGRRVPVDLRVHSPPRLLFIPTPTTPRGHGGLTQHCVRQGVCLSPRLPGYAQPTHFVAQLLLALDCSEELARQLDPFL